MLIFFLKTNLFYYCFFKKKFVNLGVNFLSTLFYFIMLVSETKIRVRYSEVDQMGFVYYGNYPAFYEVGRTEAMRQLNTSYREMEERGVMMPVISMNIVYKRPARYDNELTIRTTISELPSTRMRFIYEIFNEQGDLLNTGETVLIFIDAVSRRPGRCPEWFLEKLRPAF